MQKHLLAKYNFHFYLVNYRFLLCRESQSTFATGSEISACKWGQDCSYYYYPSTIQPMTLTPILSSHLFQQQINLFNNRWTNYFPLATFQEQSRNNHCVIDCLCFHIRSLFRSRQEKVGIDQKPAIQTNYSEVISSGGWEEKEKD